MFHFRRASRTILAISLLPICQLQLALTQPSAPASSAICFEQKLGSSAGKPSSFTLTQVTFDGSAVPNSEIAVHTLATGVHEIAVTRKTVGTWSFHVQDDSFYYGMGERFGDLNHAHTVMKNVSRDTIFGKGSSSYKPIPFFMSTAGYGLWVDTYSAATFDFDISSADIVVSFTGDKLRLVMIEGPQFPLILDRFTALAGRTQLPPYWAFAPWKARDVHFNEAEVAEDADRTRALGLPGDVVLVDSPWADGYNTFRFSTKQFAHPKEMIEHLHQQGFKLVLWLTPFINNNTQQPTELGPNMIDRVSSNFAEADAKHYFVRKPDGSTYLSQWWKGTGAMIDFTNPEAKTWWQGQVGQAIAMGADGFKDDDGEGNFVGEAKFADGSDTRMMRMRYTVLYNRAMEEVIQRQLKGNGVLFMRSASVGSQNLAMHWSGDNEGDFSSENGLPSVVRAGLSAGMSGMSLWVSDLGGYLKKTKSPGDSLSFTRWAQYSAFSPGMEVMSQTNRGPWDYGDEVLATYRKFAVLYMSLFPYRYAAAQESARSGLPMMRALVLMHQDDAEARKIEDEYEFGPDLLVAPMISLGTQRAVYVPDGEWLDLRTGAAIASRQTHIVDVPMDQAAVYVRAGAVLPKIPEDVMTLVPSKESGNEAVHSLDDRRIYEIYPGPSRSLVDFEQRTIESKQNGAGGSIHIEGASAKVTLRFPFRRVESVTVNGKPISVSESNGVASVTFDHHQSSSVEWTSSR